MSDPASRNRARDTVKLLAKTPQMTAADLPLDASAGAFLVQELDRLGRRKRRAVALARRIGYVLFILLCPFLLAFLLASQSDAAFGHMALLTVVAIVVVYVAAIAPVYSARGSKYHHTLVRLLKEHGDVSAIGPLVQALRVEGLDKKLITTALKELLPRLKASDGHLLNGEHRLALFRELTLDPETDRAFQLSLLGALEQLGDPAALPYVVPLAEGATGTVGRAARSCRAALEEAGRLEHQKQTLLRPSAASEDLLRPASSEQADTALLLRPETGD